MMTRAELEQAARAHAMTDLQQVATALRTTVDWLDNLEADIGLERLLDSSPNNWGGRVSLIAAADFVESLAERS
jgi:hypothetical protein